MFRVPATRPHGRYRRMKSLLPLGFALLVVLGVSWSSVQHKAQDRALDSVLEFFHSRNFVQYMFKEQAVAMVDITVFPMGTYVSLEVELAQTHCRKHQSRTGNCQIKPGGRKQTCLACFKFDSHALETVGKAIQCLSQQNRQFQVKRTHTQDCEEVKKTNEEEEHYLPGKFAFSRGRPL